MKPIARAKQTRPRKTFRVGDLVAVQTSEGVTASQQVVKQVGHADHWIETDDGSFWGDSHGGWLGFGAVGEHEWPRIVHRDFRKRAKT